jgi:hypothetical protein
MNTEKSQKSKGRSNSPSKNKTTVSDKTVQEADGIAKGIQKPGQTKEQTKLIAQGIQKGIETYKKQQKAKSRELDKQLKKAKRPAVNIEPIDATDLPSNTLSSQILPWGLLIASWVGFAAFLLLK